MTITADNITKLREIAALCRDNGVTVREIDGWMTRGQPGTFHGVGFINHHDASSRLSGEWGSLGYITAAVLSQWQGARCLDGVPKVALVAAGVCWHAGVGGPKLGVAANMGNYALMAGEWANSGSETYTAAALHAQAVLHRASLEVFGAPIPTNLIGHKEWATPPGRKTDPSYSMDWWRGVVAATNLHQGPPAPPPSSEDDDMHFIRITGVPADPNVYGYTDTEWWISNDEEWQAFKITPAVVNARQRDVIKSRVFTNAALRRAGQVYVIQVPGTDPKYLVMGGTRIWIRTPEMLKLYRVESIPVTSVAADDPLYLIPISGPDSPDAP